MAPPPPSLPNLFHDPPRSSHVKANSLYKLMAHVFSTSFDFSFHSRTFRSPQFFISAPILPVHPWIFLQHAFGPSLSIPHFLDSPSPLLNGTANHSTPRCIGEDISTSAF
jgi:hypothetical protein